MPRATSDTHPIRVDFVPGEAHGLLGRLGMTFAPGKKAPGIDLTWDRDLDVDLSHLKHTFGGDVLVSLVEDHELAALRIAALKEACERAQIELIRHAIRDGDVPTDHAAFRLLVRRTVGWLRAGATVVIHCRGGLGRTGLLAAACLTALGTDPAEAMRVVRVARPGAIENDAQERFLSTVDLTGAIEPDDARPSLARVRGCLLGGALGDALGEPIEFIRSASAIVVAHGESAPAKLGYARGPYITDDTQMTLFAAEGLLRAAKRWDDDATCTDAARGAFLRWLQTQGGHEGTRGARYGDGWLLDESGLHSRRAPGMTCMGALKAQTDGKTRATAAHPLNTSKGCGAVMRSAPYGLVADSRRRAFDWARDAGAITHGHPSGYLSAAHFAAVIWGVARDEPLIAAVRAADALLAAEARHEETALAVQRALELVAKGPPRPADVESLGEAWVGEEALAIALLCAGTCASAAPADVAAALWRSVVHWGDSDSTGSLTGNLLGAMYGAGALPGAWVEEVELRAVIERIAEDLHAAMEGATPDAKAYPPVGRGGDA